MRWSLVLLVAISTSAFAESTLYKCVINGRVTYTDMPPGNCQPVTRGTLAPLAKQRKVIIDGAAYDEHTAREIIRYRQSKIAEQAPAQVEAELPQQSVRQSRPRLSSGQGGRAGRNLDRVLNGEAQLEDNPAPRAGEDRAPTVITNCNSGGCYDTSGTFHPGDPNGTMNSPDGKVCHNSGGMMQCN